MQPIVDANVVLRYLLHDDESQFVQAKDAIEAGCEVTVEVLTEVVYVLSGSYEVPRKEVFEALVALLETVYVERYEEMVFALDLYAKRPLDFIDCILVAQNKVSNREVVTFDKKIRKLINT